jgi:hypothetical protein
VSRPDGGAFSGTRENLHMHAEGAYLLAFRPEYPLSIRLATFVFWEEIMALDVRLPGSGRFFEIRF